MPKTFDFPPWTALDEQQAGAYADAVSLLRRLASVPCTCGSVVEKVIGTATHSMGNRDCPRTREAEAIDAEAEAAG
jgi:hypothetical protein